MHLFEERDLGAEFGSKAKIGGKEGSWQWFSDLTLKVFKKEKVTKFLI